MKDTGFFRVFVGNTGKDRDQDIGGEHHHGTLGEVEECF